MNEPQVWYENLASGQNVTKFVHKIKIDKTPLSSTGNTKGSIPETTGYLYSKPFYGCIQSITVMTENKKFEVGETAVDFLEDVIGGSGVVGPQACSVVTTRTTITDA